MRRFISVLAAVSATLPLLALVPASRVKEPNAVFAYDVDARTHRITAVLFDRLRGKALDHLDAAFDFSLESLGGPADMVQFSPATKKIYVAHTEISPGFAGKGEDDIRYDAYVSETDFTGVAPKTVFSCGRCGGVPWIVHPAEPKLYLSIEDPYTVDEFANAKLLEVTLAPKLRTRVIARVPKGAELRLTPDGKTLYVYGQAENSRKPYGEVVSIRLRDRKRTATVVNLPDADSFGRLPMPETGDVSPDALEIAYHFGTVDVLTGKSTVILQREPRDLFSEIIGWSRDAQNLLFQLEDGNGYAPLFYQRGTKRTWELPVENATMIEWAPAQTAILFYKDDGGIGYYDLDARTWVDVFRAGEDYTGGAAWATLPTKRVPKP